MGAIGSVPMGWVMVPAALVAAGATFAVGANDASNALGTSLGSRAVSLRAALVIGACMELLGVLALGSLVSSTLKAGIIDPAAFPDPRFYVLGMFSVLCAAFAWLLVATLLGLPVSTTHTIVSGIFAFGLLERGPAAINTHSVMLVAISWVVSPLAGFLVAFIFYSVLHRLVVERNVRRGSALGVTANSNRLYPIAAGLTSAVVIGVIFVAVSKAFPQSLPTWSIIIPPLTVGILMSLVIHFWLLPWWYGHCDEWGPKFHRLLHWGDTVEGVAPTLDREDRLTEDDDDDDGGAAKAEPSSHSQGSPLSGGDKFSAVGAYLTSDEMDGTAGLIMSSTPQQMHQAILEYEGLFVSLMVATAALVAFAHGANDVGNSVAPFLVCYEWFATETIVASYKGPFWIYVLAGVFLVLGLITLGWIVMRTIGEKVTKLNPPAGFSAQMSGALVVIICTIFGLPVSTTHVIVGAVTGVGAATGLRSIQWRMIGKIVLGWLVTLVIGAGLTLALYAPLRLTVGDMEPIGTR